MAEVLGIVASLVAIGQALAAIPTIVDTLASVAAVSDELTDLVNEVSHVDQVLKTMSISTAPGSDIQEPPSLRATRSRLERVISQLTRLIDPYLSANTRNGQVRAVGLKWALKKKRIATLLSETREARLDLHFAVNTMMLESQQ
ncbi:hypothetical protein B0T26DRAFT_648518 [Lasiosphaeria miniovina]|uniref:NACHT-NTPase and P-loop NTPases N-terminal domain-containing protein n=1 Tax=Lasiosphaeria miniovina TaxID=1954250 RepID=A0AA40AAW3_9PEZI|nr:uncharacterized protein B0T26DRAFT_648518 [Lasiosphaeria miniovina]KAK0712512.1 hypothetical protein B0T26DRAFT_648518 [Lasiosphaeria miniovina]